MDQALNANLFTGGTAAFPAVPPGVYRLRSPAGPLRVVWTATGPAEAAWTPPDAAPDEAGGAGRDSVAAWLRTWRTAGPRERWAALAPGGSEWRRAVWRALLTIPAGQTETYGSIAARLGRPRAARAVGAAVGANPLACFVPCHRVVPATGGIGGFRWGGWRKRALLDAEAESGSATVLSAP